MYAMMLCALPLTGAAEPPKEDVVKTHYEKLQGAWKFFSIERGGVVVVLQPVPAGELGIAANRLSLGGIDRGEVVLNPTVTPHAIDLKYKDGKTVYGIYRVDGNTLTICRRAGATEAKDRPTEFATKGVADVEIRVYKLKK